MKTPSEITLWTGISEEEQAQRMFDAAYEWLESVLKEEPIALEGIPLKAGFWQWWDIVWQSIDRAFIDSIQFDYSLNGLLITIPTEPIRDLIRDEKQMQQIWRAYHDIRFVPVNKRVINEEIRFQVKVRSRK